MDTLFEFWQTCRPHRLDAAPKGGMLGCARPAAGGQLDGGGLAGWRAGEPCEAAGDSGPPPVNTGLARRTQHFAFRQQVMNS